MENGRPFACISSALVFFLVVVWFCLTLEQEVVSWTSADPGANHRGAHDLFRYPLGMLVAGPT